MLKQVGSFLQALLAASRQPSFNRQQLQAAACPQCCRKHLDIFWGGVARCYKLILSPQSDGRKITTSAPHAKACARLQAS
jgi:hypothetical protein